MTIAFIIGVVLFTAYVVTTSLLWGIPASLSQTFYTLGQAPKGYLFTATLWATVFLIAPLWLSVSEDVMAFSAFLACGGLLLVGAAPMFKGKDAHWHEAFAIICAVFALLWQVLNGQYWETATLAFIAIAIAVKTKTFKLCRTFWLEMIAFYSTFLSVAVRALTI